MQPSEPAEEAKKQARKLLAQLGDKIREARQAGREAALQKEAELLAEYEEAKRRAREAHPNP